MKLKNKILPILGISLSILMVVINAFIERPFIPINIMAFYIFSQSIFMFSRINRQDKRIEIYKPKFIKGEHEYSGGVIRIIKRN